MQSTLLETLKYVHRDSQEFKQFIKKLESNYDNSNKQSICLMCWGFLSSYQKKRHPTHAPYIVTPSFCRYEDQFMRFAKERDKTKDNHTLIALFNDQCPNIIENPYLTAVPRTTHIPLSQSSSQTGSK